MEALNCNGCTACCKSDRIILGPKDDPKAYRWHVENGYAVVDRKGNGECVYLDDTGCSIHGAAPDICKRFDCRTLYTNTPEARRTERVRENPSMQFVYAAAQLRMN